MSKTQIMIAVKESFNVIKAHVDFYKTFASIFLAYTTSISKILKLFKILIIRPLSDIKALQHVGFKYYIRHFYSIIILHIQFLVFELL